MVVKRMMVDCFCCNEKFQHGPWRYEIRHVEAYGIKVCEGCYSSNEDGWAPDIEKRLMDHLTKTKRPIPERPISERNAKGLLPRLS